MARYTSWCPELERDLAAPFPAEAVQTKKLKGNSIDFVPWHLYVQRLNYLVGPAWSMEPPIPMQAGGKLVLAVGLTILGVTRWNVGDEDADHEGFGSGSVNAFAQSYKRAAAMFGMGLGMYDKQGKADAVRVSQAEQEKHDADLLYIRTHGDKVADAALKKRARITWAEAKRNPAVARELADAVEAALAENAEVGA